MKRNTYVLILSAVLLAVVAISSAFNTTTIKANFKTGDTGIQSINAMAFGPEGVLFIGDSKSASIYALDTKDVEKNSAEISVEVNKFDEKVAAALGTTVDKITIKDLVVNPISKNIYFAVHTENGTPLLFKLQGADIKPVALDDASFSKTGMTNVLPEDAKDKWGRSQRVWTISDLQYDDGKVLVSGLSNLEFGSTFRSISFPFNDKEEHATLEIYHAAHGQYETHSPIKTFTTAELNGEKYIVASYTCTPLVLFPMKNLKSGAHVKGKTVAEMGNRNSPLDMITMEKDGQPFIFMSNSSRPIMKIKYSDLASFEKSLTEPVKENSGTDGIDFISYPMTNVVQMDKLDDKSFVLLQRKSNGDLDLWTANERWL